MVRSPSSLPPYPLRKRARAQAHHWQVIGLSYKPNLFLPRAQHLLLLYLIPSPRVWRVLRDFDLCLLSALGLLPYRVYRSGGLEPATELLERNLISIGLKEQLLGRPALKDLERRGILPNDMTAVNETLV